MNYWPIIYLFIYTATHRMDTSNSAKLHIPLIPLTTENKNTITASREKKVYSKIMTILTYVDAQ